MAAQTTDSVSAAVISSQAPSLSDIGTCTAQQSCSSGVAMSCQAVPPTDTGLVPSQLDNPSTTSSALQSVSKMVVSSITTVSSSGNISTSTTTSQASAPSLPSPLAVQFPEGKICRMQFDFPALAGLQVVTDDDDIFIGQIEKEEKMEELHTLNQSFKVTTVTVNASAGVITVKKKGRMSQEGVKRWMEDVKGKIMAVIGTVKSEVLQIGLPAEEIHRSVLAKFSTIRVSCLLSQDKQSLLIVSTDDTEVSKIKDFVTAKLKDAKWSLKMHAAPAAAVVTRPASAPPVIQPASSPSLLSPQVALSPTHPGCQSTVTTSTVALPPASGTVSLAPTSAQLVTPSSHAITSGLTSSAPTPSSISAPVAASQSSIAGPGVSVHVTQPEAKLLESEKVFSQFLAQLMNDGVIIDVSTISTGNITVKHGDPAKVLAVVKSLICLSSLAAKANDSDVSKELQTLLKTFPTQIESEYDMKQEEYVVACHRSVEAEVLSAIQKLQIVQKVIPIPSFKANFLQHHIQVLKLEIQSSLKYPVEVDITTNSQAQSMVFISANRRGFSEAQMVVEKVLADLQQKVEEVDGALVLHLQGFKGQKAVQAIEKKHVCQITVRSPQQQVIMQVTTPKGQQLMVCEGNMAVSDCQMIVIPLLDGQTDWPLYHRHVLKRGFLTADIQQYFTEVGHSSRAHTMVLQCHGVAAGQRVVIMSLPASASDMKSKKRIEGAFKEAVATASYPKASIALLLNFGADIPMDESLQCILPVVKEHLEKGDNSGTMVLYTDHMAEPQLVKMKNAIQQSMSPQWDVQDCMGLHKSERDAEPAASETKKPAVCIVGQRTNVTKALEGIKKISVPEKYQKLIHALETAGELKVESTTVTGGNVSTSPPLSPQAFLPQAVQSYVLPLSQWTTKTGIKVLVHKTDITKLTVDVVVNTANGGLNHSGGVAAAIAKAAGPALVNEGDAYVKKNGPLKVTEVLLTTAGAMPCSEVLHAVGPRWDDYQDKTQCQQDLEQTIFNCLKKAHDLGFYSLAVSSISSDIFGVPRKVCAQMYLSAVKSFDQQYGEKTTLQLVHFVDVSDVMVSVIQDTFTRGWKIDGVLPNIPVADTAHSQGSVATPSSSQNSTVMKCSILLPADDNLGAVGGASPDVHPSGISAHGSYGNGDKKMPVSGSVQEERPVATAIGSGATRHKGQYQCRFHFLNLDLIFQHQKITNFCTDAVVMWQYMGNILKDEDSKQLIKKWRSSDVSALEKGLTEGAVQTVVNGDKLYVFPVVSSRNPVSQDKVREVLEQVLHKVDLQRWKSVAITRCSSRREVSKSAEEFITGVYLSLKKYTQGKSNAITEVHILDTELKVLKVMEDAVSRMFSSDTTNMEQNLKLKSQSPYASSKVPSSASVAQFDDTACVLCHHKITNPKTLSCCSLTICSGCLDIWMKLRSVCPKCGTAIGVLMGNQPENGTLKMHRLRSQHLPGYNSCGTLQIDYHIPSGFQKAEHPNPGRQYTGTSRTAYLPNTKEGRKALMLLKVAFGRRLIFTVGQSATTGLKDVVIWSDICHKTSITGGPINYGYPDPDYLTRLQEKLAEKGVTEKDLTDTQKAFIQNPGLTFLRKSAILV